MEGTATLALSESSMVALSSAVSLEGRAAFGALCAKEEAALGAPLAFPFTAQARAAMWGFCQLLSVSIPSVPPETGDVTTR